MSITDKTRKLLWGRSGNRCAICRLELAIDATACDDASLVGEECHIHSGREGGPRYDLSVQVNNIDGYENLLLLCRVHHKMVDDQCEAYTAELLVKMKDDHENWVKEKLTGTPEVKSIRFKRIRENALPCLGRLTSGKDVLNIVDGACMFSFDHDELSSDKEVELVGGFIQEARDWGELGGDLEPIQKVRTGFRLSECLGQLENAGFYVFGGREIHRIEGGVELPSPWPVAIIQVLRSTNPLIVSVVSGNPQAEGSGKS